LTSLLDRGPPSPPLSLYVHVPFCTDRCTYCAFATLADRPSLHGELVEALVREYDRLPTRPAELNTIYIGGGTPGLLSLALLDRLLEAIRARTPIRSTAEITLEVNPANVTAAALEGWSALGINRLSMGIQTFDDPTLARLGRHHDGDDGQRALDLLSARWTESWSADLLVGWVGQSSAALELDLGQLLARRPPHISVYGLTIEPGTPLAALERIGSKVRLNDSQLDIYDQIWSISLQEAGYERYEVSNFARAGSRSRHNQMYWHNEDYLGIGPGAASSVHPLRWSNIRDTLQYIDQVGKGLGVRSRVERLAPLDRLLESLGVGLRTSDGLETTELDRRFGTSWRQTLSAGIDELTQAQMLEEVHGRLKTPSEAMTRADSIAAVLARTLEVSQPDPHGAPRSTGC
jgi:oxygen-independent coproporphyrinogen-3 oxidase